MKPHSVRGRLERLDRLCTPCVWLTLAWGAATMALSIGACVAGLLSTSEQGWSLELDIDPGHLLAAFERWWMRAIGIAWLVTGVGPLGLLALSSLSKRAVPRRPSLGYVEVSGRFVPRDRARASVIAARRREWKRREENVHGADRCREIEECLVCEGFIGTTKPAFRSRDDVLCEPCHDVWIAPEAPDLP